MFFVSYFLRFNLDCKSMNFERETDYAKYYKSANKDQITNILTFLNMLAILQVLTA